jgi:cysteinyl-tRNA synthetase
MLHLHDTATGTVRPFELRTPGEVSMYICGPTVYDLPHIGHGRFTLTFDVLRRYQLFNGLAVRYVSNITDVDDNIIKRATAEGRTEAEVAEEYETRWWEAMDLLGVLRPNDTPHATAYIERMVALVEDLVARGVAYEISDGVYLNVAQVPGYGLLARQPLESLQAGARVEAVEEKRSPLDFVLWKKAKPEEPADAKWPSPWGDGRPGWAIECSAMSCALLGNHFDIHGGGEDLQFPHHENEIAQSEGANHEHFVNVWMHNAFVVVDDTKMSKSLGNFFTIRDVLKVYDAEVLRFLLVRTHYRTPLHYSSAHLDDARGALTRLYTALKNTPPSEEVAVDWDEPHAARFRDAMDDDFNTPPAFAAQLKALGAIVGLLQRDPVAFLQGADADGADADIERKITERAAAKKSRDFALADRIRKELSDAGIILEDSAAGTTWRRG